MSCCYIVATPIGNLDDITIRAVNTLKKVDLILAEDTQHTRRLLAHYAITTALLSLNEHNEQQRLVYILNELKQGRTLALVSDAGTPLISDPGYLLVSTLRRKGIDVVPIPGANAAVTALSASGLKSRNFTFIGFLPTKPKQRIDALNVLKYKPETLIFYESPKRILTLIKAIDSIFGSKRLLCLAKELTKVFETIMTQNSTAMIHWLEEDIRRQKGEFVLLVEGADAQDKLQTSNAHIEHVLTHLLTELSTAKAAKIAAKILAADKKQCYQLALQLKPI